MFTVEKRDRNLILLSKVKNVSEEKVIEIIKGKDVDFSRGVETIVVPTSLENKLDGMHIDKHLNEEGADIKYLFNDSNTFVIIDPVIKEDVIVIII